MATAAGSRHRGWWIALGVLAGLALILVIAAFFAEEPLRRYAEGQANQRLPDYHTTIGGLDLHPLTLAAELRDVVVRQQANPEPPLAAIPYARAGIRLVPLFTGTIAADLHIDRLSVSVTKAHVDAAFQKKDQPEVTEPAAAWQDTVRDLMPFRVALSVTNGDISYQGAPAVEPVYIQGLDITARHVTNRAPQDEPYPAELHLKAHLLDRALLTIDGHADLLAKPHPAVEADMNLRDLDIPTVLRTMGRSDVPVKQGVVAVGGHVEYASAKQAVTIHEVMITKPVVDYVAATPSGEPAAHAKDTATAAWQDRVMGGLPITVQRASIQDGEVTYRPSAKANPLRIHRLDVTVSDLRNERSQGDMPSGLHVSARLSEEAEVALDGRADFFAKPVPGVDAQMKVQQLRLASLLPLAESFHVYPSDGTLDLQGRVRHAKSHTIVVVDQLLVEGAKLDYVHVAATKENDAQRAQGAEAAQNAPQEPAVVLKVKHGKILHSEVGFVNKAVSPEYRIFLADMNVEMENLSNRVAEGTGVIKVTGKFMGSGPTVMTATFRPEKPTPDFELGVRIIKTKLTSLNNVFRAHGNLDMQEGVFAFFSEIKVKDGKVEGYVRPFFKDVDVYDPAQDRHKSKLNKIYQALVGGVATILKNEPRKEVATETELKGPIENPKASTWQIVGHLVQNAFFEAITPGMKG